MWRDEDDMKTQSQNLNGVKFPCQIRLLSDSVTVYAGIGFEYVRVGSLSNRDFPEIVEVKEDKESRLWGAA